jgi:tetratricopeptide (TPR) repeat protein
MRRLLGSTVLGFVAAVAGCGGGNGAAPAMIRGAPVPAPASTPARGGAGHAHSHGDIGSLAPAAAEAKRLEGLGTYGRAVATTEPLAQTFFDQGLRLYWAFNHDEAYRSFAQAAALDPRCTMCFWGAALTLGPNYNMPMLPDRTKPAWEALQRARALAGAAPAVERDLVSALATRYAGPTPVDEKTAERHNRAYADAMRAVASKYPEDADVQSLFAESAMVLNPWKLWAPDGSPAPGTAEIVATLEATMAKNRAHPGANHLYIHAIEASKTPEKAVPAADRVATMMPNAGHLVHMPAHIYQRVGRYEDAAAANRRAVLADRRYAEAIAPRHPPGVYEMYMGHNYQFLAVADLMQGKSAEAIEAAQNGSRLSTELVLAMPAVELFAAMHAVLLMRFAKWSDVLATTEPARGLPTARGLWHHARGIAFAATERPTEAQAELDKLSEIKRTLPPDHPAMMNKANDVLEIAKLVLEGRIAERRADPAAGVARLEEAVRREDALSYDEPPNWWYPTRHLLGATLLRARRGGDAEAVYRADLRVAPENGWSLYGLAKALEMQGRTAESKQALERARAAWKNADVPLALAP